MMYFDAGAVALELDPPQQIEVVQACFIVVVVELGQSQL